MEAKLDSCRTTRNGHFDVGQATHVIIRNRESSYQRRSASVLADYLSATVQALVAAEGTAHYSGVWWKRLEMLEQTNVRGVSPLLRWSDAELTHDVFVFAAEHLFLDVHLGSATPSARPLAWVAGLAAAPGFLPALALASRYRELQSFSAARLLERVGSRGVDARLLVECLKVEQNVSAQLALITGHSAPIPTRRSTTGSPKRKRGNYLRRLLIARFDSFGFCSSLALRAATTCFLACALGCRLPPLGGDWRGVSPVPFLSLLPSW